LKSDAALATAPRLLYRTTYAADLRREFPRIPLYDGFARWTAWGRTLLDLHIGYETVVPAALARVDVPTGKPPVPKFRSLPDTGVIVLDSDTQLTGVPRAAWDYRLGNRSAIDWVLDQHKEKKIKNPTVAKLFDTYRFADHKERVIDLLARVVTVSLETVAITTAMAELERA
jgi:predicted helicase